MSVTAAIASGLASGIAGSAVSSASSSSAESGGIQSSIQGSVPVSTEPVPAVVTGSQSADLIEQTAKDMLSGVVARGSNNVMDRVFSTASQQGRDTKDYLAAAFPELNPWERSGAGGSMSGSASAGMDNASDMQGKQLAAQLTMKEMDNETALKVAGINSATSIKNTQSQVYAQNERLPYDIQVAKSQLLKIAADTSLSEQQRINKMAEVPLIQQNTMNARYSKSVAGRLAGDVGALSSDVVNQLTPSVRAAFDAAMSKFGDAAEAIRSYGEDIQRGSGVSSNMGRGLGNLKQRYKSN